MNTEKLMIRFKPEEKTPVAHVGAGEMRRTFERKKQPFEVSAEEWPVLERTGLFEIVPEEPAAGGAGVQAETQKQGAGKKSEKKS